MLHSLSHHRHASLSLTSPSHFTFAIASAVESVAISSLSASESVTVASATDSITITLGVLHQDETPLLYSLAFGEGVVNDATSVVLFNAVRKINANSLAPKAPLRILLDFMYLFSTSTLLGVTAWLLTSYILRGLGSGRHSSVREISLMILIAYLSYMLTEWNSHGLFCWSFGPFTHYAWHNVTEISRITTSFWRSIGIYSIVMLLILLGCASFVFPLSAIANYMHRSGEGSSKITGNHQ